jgi:hypothetical protein
MTIEPLRSHVTREQMSRQRNPYEGRWNWWYSSIADIMIRDPSIKMVDIALELNKAANTISMIVNTDMFQEYLARRKEAWRKEHDFTILSKVTRVAELSLDSVAEQLAKKKDQVPLPVAVEAMNSALDRLGYSPKTSPTVSVQVDNSSRSQTVVVQGVSASALEEARAALRVAESKRAEDYDGRLARHSAPKLIEASNPDSGSEVDGEQGSLDFDLTNRGDS